MPRDRPNRAEVSEDLVLARPSGKPSVIVATRVKFGLAASHRPLSLRLQPVGTPVARRVVTSRSVTRDVITRSAVPAIRSIVRPAASAVMPVALPRPRHFQW